MTLVEQYLAWLDEMRPNPEDEEPKKPFLRNLIFPKRKPEDPLSKMRPVSQRDEDKRIARITAEKRRAEFARHAKMRLKGKEGEK